MRKFLSTLLALFSICFSGVSQNATSVQNGNWMNPLTWSCTCIPLPGFTVTINHAVALDTGWYLPSGGITINAGGSLIENNSSRDILVNGGTLTNHGTLDIRYLFVQAGSFSNSGTLTARSLMSYVNFTNTGTIQNIDSLYSTGAIINDGSFLDIDSITTGGTFTNNGICTYNQFTNTGEYTNNNTLTFTDLTNLGTFTNSDSITCLHSSWNTEIFKNLSSGYFILYKSLLNADSVQHNATLDNNGRIIVNDSWYNADTVKGTATGSFQVSDSSVNWGWMKGDFDFCDSTPPISTPFIDFNFGTISSGITWCILDAINENQNEQLSIYPNPSTNCVFINSPDNCISDIKIYSFGGIPVVTAKNSKQIDVSELSPGLYLLSATRGQKQYLFKLQITN